MRIFLLHDKKIKIFNFGMGERIGKRSSFEFYNAIVYFSIL